MQLKYLGRESRFTEMGQLDEEKNAGIKASCPRVSTANYRLKNYFHGGQPTNYIHLRYFFQYYA